jgi:hypothetical protein
MSLPPQTFNWKGSDAENLYWDDPSNWEEGKYPDQKDAIVIFSNSISSDTTILLRKDIHLGKFWISEKHSLTFESKPEVGTTADFYLETSNQFSPIFIDRDNLGDIRFAKLGPHFFHSCYFGQTHRDLALGKPIPSGARATTIHMDSVIGNYKDPERASLQVFGHLTFELNSANTFKGPVVAKDNGQVRAMVEGAIPDQTPIAIANGGSVYAEDGVLIKTSELNVDGKLLKPGLYFSKEVKSFDKTKLSKMNLPELPRESIEGLSGLGAIVVSHK